MFTPYSLKLKSCRTAHSDTALRTRKTTLTAAPDDSSISPLVGSWFAFCVIECLSLAIWTFLKTNTQNDTHSRNTQTVQMTTRCSAFDFILLYLYQPLFTAFYSLFFDLLNIWCFFDVYDLLLIYKNPQCSTGLLKTLDDTADSFWSVQLWSDSVWYDESQTLCHPAWCFERWRCRFVSDVKRSVICFVLFIHLQRWLFSDSPCIPSALSLNANMMS